MASIGFVKEPKNLRLYNDFKLLVLMTSERSNVGRRENDNNNRYFDLGEVAPSELTTSPRSKSDFFPAFLPMFDLSEVANLES